MKAILRLLHVLERVAQVKMSTSEITCCSKPSRVSNKGKPHRARTASEPGEIYIITNKINKKKYVGQAYSFKTDGKPYGSKERWNGHKNDARVMRRANEGVRLELPEELCDVSKPARGCRALSSAINKYGEDNFELEVILRCGSDQLDHYEAKFIDMYNSLAQNGHGYNLRSGGNGNGRADDTTRQLMSDAHRGEKHHMFGKHHSEASKAKISKTLQNITRMDFDGVTVLPRGIKAVNDAGNVGYVLLRHMMLTNNTKVQFSATRARADADKSLLTSLLAKCVFYLKYLDKCAVCGDMPMSKKDVIKAFASNIVI